MASLKLSRKLTLIGLSLTLILAWGCAPKPYAVPTDECGPVEPSDQDVRFALDFGKDMFVGEEWVKSYTVDPYRVSVTHQNESLSAIAYVEYLMFNCGYGQAELDEYFNDEGFSIVYGNYESYTLSSFCEIDNLALFEYDLVDSGIQYSSRYWVKQESDTRILVAMLVFPTTDQTQLNGYAARLFPNLVTCKN